MGSFGRSSGLGQGLVAGMTLATCLWSTLFPAFAWSAEPRITPPPLREIYRKEPAEIPTSPSAPKAFSYQAPKNPFRCERLISYQGKDMACDSDVRKDAERLRPILQETPAAIAELNTYQRNRRGLTTAAYIGSIGLALMILAPVIAGSLPQKKGRNATTGLPESEDSATAKVLRAVGLYGGLTLTAGSVVYGITILRTNESHLTNAIDLHNSAHPDRPIQLMFSTGIVF